MQVVQVAEVLDRLQAVVTTVRLGLGVTLVTLVLLEETVIMEVMDLEPLVAIQEIQEVMVIQGQPEMPMQALLVTRELVATLELLVVATDPVTLVQQLLLKTI